MGLTTYGGEGGGAQKIIAFSLRKNAFYFRKNQRWKNRVILSSRMTRQIPDLADDFWLLSNINVAILQTNLDVILMYGCKLMCHPIS